ncbi:MAG TPA: EF-P beta-lysylation protein EpmB [Gammaproteobacteria bacterium]|nr:EF-P beta-lysylation protein EpmB [Gammaproteobacteria bacterium]
MIKAPIIPRTAVAGDRSGWQQALARAYRTAGELLAALDLDDQVGAAVREAARQFPVRVPRSFAARMGRGDPHDPLLRQVLPIEAETLAAPGYGPDPLDESAAMTAPGVLHKYHGRVLLTVTGACAVHCRYCFRRHFPYAQANAGAEDWAGALAYLGSHPEVSEVILSGGDPLALADSRLSALVGHLSAIPHLQRLRIHSRTPIVLPERVDGQLLDWLGSTRLQTVIVVHANHPNEIDDSVGQAMQALSGTGATLLNQSVLLKGVNDGADILTSLSETLFDTGVLPYYLHQLDRVAGGAHFEVDDRRALALMGELHRRLPGYLVPRLVREEPGAPGKTALSSSVRTEPI